jgi:hypothetical protein
VECDASGEPLSSVLPDVACLHPSVTGDLNVKAQPVTSRDGVWADASCLQCSSVQKHVGAAGIVRYEAEASVRIPHFEFSSSHSIPFAFNAVFSK